MFVFACLLYLENHVSTLSRASLWSSSLIMWLNLQHNIQLWRDILDTAEVVVSYNSSFMLSEFALQVNLLMTNRHSDWLLCDRPNTLLIRETDRCIPPCTSAEQTHPCCLWDTCIDEVNIKSTFASHAFGPAPQMSVNYDPKPLNCHKNKLC